MTAAPLFVPRARPGDLEDTGPSARFLEETVLPNLRAGVAVVLREEPRAVGIEELEDDPVYENLYDRFYAIMSDGAALEHLAVAALVEGGEQVRAAGTRALSCLARAWSAEVGRSVGYGNAYALTRLLKSLAVGFDAFASGLDQQEREAVERFLTELAGRLWSQWFSRRDVGGRTGLQPGRHSPHHASVEWSAFGIGALALLGRHDPASRWVDAVVEHFDRELLPRTLAVDGAPPEGRDFWVSTMFSRVQLLDALRNRTGEDLLAGHPASVRTELAEVLFRGTPPLAPEEGGEDRLQLEDWQLLPRGAGAVLLWLADRCDDPELQALGMLDRRAGSLESSSFALPRSGIRLRFATSSYAALWTSTEVTPADRLEPRLATFPSISLCATSRGWRTGGGFSAAIDEGRVLLWAGGELVLRDLAPESRVDLEASREAGTGIFAHEPPDLFGTHVTATRLAGGGDLLEARNADDDLVARVVVSADGLSARVERRLAPSHRWRTALPALPVGGPDTLAGADARDAARPTAGRVTVTLAGCRLGPAVAVEAGMAVGYGLLECVTDHPGKQQRDHDVHATTADRWVAVDLHLTQQEAS